MDERKYHALILASLVHDLGKVWTRAAGTGMHGPAIAQALRDVSGLFPAGWRDRVCSAVESHHILPVTHAGWVIRAADRLASGELIEPGDGDPAAHPLRPTAAHIDLGRPLPKGGWGYPLKPLSEDGPLFPEEDVAASPGEYAYIREGLLADLERLAECGGLTSPPDTLGLLSVLRRWTTYVPAAAAGETDEEYPTAPDIGLYDHLKLTGALATCLADLDDAQLGALTEDATDAWAAPIALLLRADFSGIQSFIYRITASRADGTFSGAARRLRGRSLYLVLLADAVADWLLRELGLPPTNILFNGGGRFDLLLPLTAKERVEEQEARLHRWLLDTFYGELGIQIATVSARPSDFVDMRQVYGALDDELALCKHRKFELFVRGQAGPAADFHVPRDQLYHACNVCHLTPLPDPGPCEECELHMELGGKLPSTTHVAFLYGDVAGRLPEGELGAAISLGDPFNVTIALLDQTGAYGFLDRVSEKGESPGEATLYRLNDVDFIPPAAPPGVALGFRFLASEAPLDSNDNVLDFDAIAKQSQGAQLLGVLKADVDRLGFIFGEGMTPTLSRASTLSGAMELFFGGRLDALCGDVAAKAFYTVYAGGDDLLILGPWDQTVILAQRLYQDFRRYTCCNENVTLSAGVLLVKPHFPIHRFARLADEALEEAKSAGRDRITVFTETVDWETSNDGESAGYDRLLAFGREMAQRVEDQQLPKGFVYFLKRLHDAHFDETGMENPMWVPKFHYAVARRVPEEVVRDLNLLSQIPSMMKHIQVPVSYVSLKTRKE